LDARLTTLLCKKIHIFTKSKEVKTGYNLAESSKEGCGSKRAVLPMMMMKNLAEEKSCVYTNTFDMAVLVPIRMLKTNSNFLMMV
jgi:hypothetical protein